MASKLKVGAAKRDITPPIGTYLSGFIARLEPSHGAADPLHVRAVVAAAREKVAVVQADVLGFDAWQVAEVREFAHSHLGIPRDHLLLSATHTHSGPGLVPVRGCGMAPYAYQWAVVDGIKGALAEGDARLSPAILELGSGPFSLGINRRQETPNGVVLGVAPDKPRPLTLDVARVKTSEQEILFLTHACHPYILGAQSLWVSGDFPSLACSELEKNDQTVALFLAGCAGNIAPQSAFQGIEKAREEGHRMVAAVRKISEELQPALDGPVAACNTFVHLPYLPLPSEKEIEGLAGEQERVVRPEERGEVEIQRRLAAALDEWKTLMKRVVDLTWPLHPSVCEVQAVRFGSFVLLGIAGEPFFEIGEKIRAGSPFRDLWPLGYANAYCGYIPTREEYPGGGYEVNDSWKYVGMWKIDDTCEQRVLEAAWDVLREIA